MTSTPTLSRSLTTSVRVAAIAVAAVSVLLAGCGKKDEKKAASQTAARVNKEDITIHQINHVLQAQRGLPPEQAASASHQVLEKLIDQELTVQKAAEQKLDRDPRVVAQIDAARREIISRAYLEKIGAGAPKPSPEEIKAYYDAHPELFRERRVYNLQEIVIEAKPEQLADLQSRLQNSKDINDFVAYLKASQIKFGANQAVRAAEQLPLARLQSIAQMKDGQAQFVPTARGAQVLVLVSSRLQPVDEDRARAPIETYLVNERKRKVIEDDLKSLRSSAKIEYVGDFVPTARPATAASATEVKPTKSPLTSTPASAPEPILPVQPASMPTGTTLEQGIKGLK
jgi:EpsD family peptidyl-prolyl cis-trans isomerase